MFLFALIYDQRALKNKRKSDMTMEQKLMSNITKVCREERTYHILHPFCRSLILKDLFLGNVQACSTPKVVTVLETIRKTTKTCCVKHENLLFIFICLYLFTYKCLFIYIYLIIIVFVGFPMV